MFKKLFFVFFIFVLGVCILRDFKQNEVLEFMKENNCSDFNNAVILFVYKDYVSIDEYLLNNQCLVVNKEKINSFLKDKGVDEINLKINFLSNEVKYENILTSSNIVLNNEVSSCYGKRSFFIGDEFYSDTHRGIDFVSPEKTPVFAYNSGVVTNSAYSSSYGYWIEISNDFEVSRYAHLYELSYPIGYVLNKGDQVGISGNTGLSTGPHLHFELFEDGKRVDPYFRLKTTGIRCE